MQSSSDRTGLRLAYLARECWETHMDTRNVDAFNLTPGLVVVGPGGVRMVIVEQLSLDGDTETCLFKVFVEQGKIGDAVKPWKLSVELAEYCTVYSIVALVGPHYHTLIEPGGWQEVLNSTTLDRFWEDFTEYVDSLEDVVLPPPVQKTTYLVGGNSQPVMQGLCRLCREVVTQNHNGLGWTKAESDSTGCIQPGTNHQAILVRAVSVWMAETHVNFTMDWTSLVAKFNNQAL